MAAAETESHFYRLARGVEVAACRQDRAGIIQNERSVELGEFFDCPAKVGVSDVSRVSRMGRQGV